MSKILSLINPFSNGLIKVIRFNLKKNNVLVHKIKKKLYCQLCNGRGYTICNVCSDGCSRCNYVKYNPCVRCSGLGFVSYTYF